MLSVLIILRCIGIAGNGALFGILVAETLGKVPVIIGVTPKRIPFVWEMYGYSNRHISHGFSLPVTFCVEILLTDAVLLFPLIRKSFIIRSIGV